MVYTHVLLTNSGQIVAICVGQSGLKKWFASVLPLHHLVRFLCCVHWLFIPHRGDDLMFVREKGIIESLGEGNGGPAAVFSLKKGWHGGAGLRSMIRSSGGLQVLGRTWGDANMTEAEGPSLSLLRSAFR